MSDSVRGQVPEDQAGADPLSPRTLIYNQLRQQGLPLTSDNVRRLLEANAANPGAIGGTGRDDAYSNAEMPVHLVNDVAGTDPKVSAAPRQRGLPTPPIPPKLGEEQGPPRPELNQPSLPNQGMQMTSPADLARWILGRGNAAPPPPPNLQLELRNPTQPPQLGGPGSSEGGGGGRPVVPQLPPPSPPSPARIPALPAPSAIPPVTLTTPQAPAATVAPANPAVPPVAMDRAMEPARQPRVTVTEKPAPLRAPPISPENPVVKGPVAEGIGKAAAGAGRVAAGAASGLRSGGPRGAVVGGGAAAAKELIPPLVEAIRKGAARRKAPSKRPVAS